jgi:hypothetical protein
MSSIAFDFSWIEAAPSPDKLSQATMAELTIKIDDHIVTTVLDRRMRAYRDRVVVPLLPLAEWMVTNWWFLYYEPDVESPAVVRQGFSERHDVRYAGDGFFLPSLTISSVGDRARLSTEPWNPRHGAVEFLGRYSRTVDRSSLEAALRTVVDAVIERLQSNKTPVAALERDWAAINSVQEDERSFCKAAALLGIDAFEADDATSATIVRLWETMNPSLREDLFACSDPSSASAVASWIQRGLTQLNQIPSGDGWATLRRNLSQEISEIPWERGYELARRARKSIGTTGGGFDFDGAWAVGNRELNLPSDRIDALVAENAPSCLIRARSEIGRRFLLARAVGDYLSRPTHEPQLLTSVSTEKQALSRAFAAEFLAPSVALRTQLGSAPRYIDADAIDDLARRFGVSSFVIRHQIQNHKLGTIIETV